MGGEEDCVSAALRKEDVRIGKKLPSSSQAESAWARERVQEGGFAGVLVAEQEEGEHRRRAAAAGGRKRRIQRDELVDQLVVQIRMREGGALDPAVRRALEGERAREPPQIARLAYVFAAMRKRQWQGEGVKRQNAPRVPATRAAHLGGYGFEECEGALRSCVRERV